MPTAGRRRRTATVAVAASAVAHGVLMAVLAVHRPVLSFPDEPSGPPAAIIPILLLPRTPPSAPGAPAQSQLRLHRRAQRFAPVPPTVTPLVTAAPVAEAPARAAPSPAPPASPAIATPGADLRAALRQSAVGCANPTALSRAERDRCDERLGRGATAEAYIPTPLEPRVRAYYDAVAAAKKPDGQPVPQRAIGGLSLFDADPRGQTGHGPGVGCKLPFGGGQKKKLPSNWLSLGPCYIAPPKGPLTVEADITPP